jgi:hypothetical protein
VSSEGLARLADLMLNPPVLTFCVVWQPDPLQSSVPIGMWFAEVEAIATLANVLATLGPWQLRQSVTPMWVPLTEYTA